MYELRASRVVTFLGGWFGLPASASPLVELKASITMPGPVQEFNCSKSNQNEKASLLLRSWKEEEREEEQDDSGFCGTVSLPACESSCHL